MASFLKKTAFAKPEATTETKTIEKPKLGGVTKPLGKPGPLGKKPTSLLKKKIVEPSEIELEQETEEVAKPESKPKLGATKKLGNKLSPKKIEEKPEESDITEVEVIKFQETVDKMEEKQGIYINEDKEVFINAETVKIKEEKPVEEPKEIEIEEETVEESKEEEELSPQQRAARTRKKNAEAKKKATDKKEDAKKESKKKEEKNILESFKVDETKRITLEEMDAIMRPIVAPSTELWEQEKADVLEALNSIKVEQDMDMSQVKACLSELDELKFEILPKQHDAETMYDGTKQNYDTVKAVAIAKGSGTNAEARKAEGILACQNFVTPSGAVVDLHQYMLLIEERYKFYEKISDGVNFKKYSLVNYNNALKVEKEK